MHMKREVDNRNKQKINKYYINIVYDLISNT